MQKIKVILFLMLSICILSSCGNDKNTTEENKKSEKSDYNGIKEIDFSNKDNEKLKKFLAFYTSNKDKYMYYSSALEEYTLMFGYDYLYEVYLIAFINGENEFQADEEKVSSFKSSLVTFDERFGNVYEQFKNLIPLIKEELNKGIDKNGNGIDEKYKEIVEEMKNMSTYLNEIITRFEKTDYKEIMQLITEFTVRNYLVERAIGTL